MAEYGVDTSNTFALLEDDGAAKKAAATKDPSLIPAVARKKVDKKDKEKHGQAARGGNASAAESSRPKKHDFDRRPGPGPQRKVDKRSGAGKWDKEQTTGYPDETLAADFTQDEQDTPSSPTTAQGGAAPTDAKDGKAKKPEDSWVDLDEYREAQKSKRPEGDDLKPRAPRVDGDFRAVKEFVKEEEPVAYQADRASDKKESEKKPQTAKGKKVEKKEVKRAPSKKKAQKVTLSWGQFYTKVKPVSPAKESDQDYAANQGVQSNKVEPSQHQGAEDFDQVEPAGLASPTSPEGSNKARDFGENRGRGDNRGRGRGRGEGRGRGRGRGGEGRGRGGEGRGRGGPRGFRGSRGSRGGSRGGGGGGGGGDQGVSKFTDEAEYPKLK